MIRPPSEDEDEMDSKNDIGGSDEEGTSTEEKLEGKLYSQ